MCASGEVCIARAVVHENRRTTHNWACVVSKGSSFYFCRETWWLHLQFHLSDFTKAVPFILHRPFIFPSNLSSLLPFLKTTTTAKQQEQATKKRSEQNLVHVGIEPSKTNQTRWERHNSTFIPSLHAHQNSHSRPFHIKDSACARLSSNKSS